MICKRCKKETNVWRTSMFNTDDICPECIEKEKTHPDYPKAREAEHKAVLAVDYNFPGIGKPDDL